MPATIQDGFRWEGNHARIYTRLYDVGPADTPADRIELVIVPAPGRGVERGWYMNLEDALAIVAMLSRMAFLLTVGTENVTDSLGVSKDAPQAKETTPQVDSTADGATLHAEG